MTTLNGHCPEPFLQESLFPTTGGFLDGRYCERRSANLSCCLPCPLADWRYADNIGERVSVASWISVAVLPLCIFLLISYAVLPAKATNRHYLSICFTVGICFMEIAFVIPLGAKPEQCYNEITPNDMYSNLSCAFSGAFLLFGGWVVIIWSFIRTLAFHLQVCWEFVLGPRFMWGAFLCGIGIPAIGMTVMLLLTGVSFRFGDICHINIHHGLQDYWAPIMAFSIAALVLQLITMCYCTHIYLRSLFDRSASPTERSSGLPSYTSSVRALTARQAYRRVRRLVQLQWRGSALVVIIIVNVIFFAVAFIKLDNQVEDTPANLEIAQPWVMCLFATKGDKESCKSYASHLGPNKATLLAVVYLLALVGFWNFILFARPSMFTGWLDLFRRVFGQPGEISSSDAHGRHPESKGFEMLTTSAKTPDLYMRSPSPGRMGGHSPLRSPSPTLDRNVQGVQEARYVPPLLSFSGPRPPTSPPAGREWDPTTTFAKGSTQ